MIARSTREPDHSLPGNSVEKAVRRRRVQLAVDDEENISPGALGQLAAPVEHQGVVESLGLGHMLGRRANHVEPGRLCLGRSVCSAGRAQFAHFVRMPLARASGEN
jgi:hypothetical protein